MIDREYYEIKDFALAAFTGILANKHESYTDEDMCLLAWSYAQKMASLGKKIRETQQPEKQSLEKIGE